MTDIEQSMILALAEIDAELGLSADGCNSTARTITAIRLLHAAHRDDVAYIERLQQAAELSLGILWTIEDRSGKVRDAHRVLFDALGKEGLKRGIAAAIGRGYEAEHPSGADWWAGKKP